jgi:hypothetical protein
MLQKIASNKFYTINIDLEQNLLYLELSGFWGSHGNVPEYLNDCGRAATQLRPGFCALVDITKTTAISEEAMTLHQKVQKIFMNAGLSKVAELYRPDDSIMQYQVSCTTRASGVARSVHVFTDRAAALTWLLQPTEMNVSILDTLRKWLGR